MPKGKPWTREEEKQLRDLRVQGLKVSEIAAMMVKSEEAILKKRQRIGLKVSSNVELTGLLLLLLLPLRLLCPMNCTV